MRTCPTCGLRRQEEAFVGGQCDRCDKIAGDAISEIANELALQASPGAAGWSG